MGRRKQALDGLGQDIRDHIERETQDNIDGGMSPEEARRQAAVDQLLGFALDVIADVLVDFVEGTAARHGCQRWSAGCRMRAMARASASHLFVSMSSCLRPLTVRT